MNSRTQGDGADCFADTAEPLLEEKNSAAIPGAIDSEKRSTSKTKLEEANNKLLKTWQKKRALSNDTSVFFDLKNADDFALPPPDIPKDRLVPVHPSRIVRKSAVANASPRFVACEPYKASVTSMKSPPLLPPPESKVDRNNLDLSVLVSQISAVTEAELRKQVEEKVEKSKMDESLEMKELRQQIEALQEEKKYFEGKLKFQAQVNAELKNLLVAAVGEDVHEKVNLLTEDKLHLAKALLTSTKDLSTHTEQIESLAGQSEVWRSKFLASSLMVEELARWKANLSQKNLQLVTANRQLLETMAKLWPQQMEILQNVSFLAGNQRQELNSATVVNLADESADLSRGMVLQHSKMGIPAVLDLSGLEHLTEAEEFAIEALQCTQQSLTSTEEAQKAILGQAFPSVDSMSRREENLLVEQTKLDQEENSK